MQKSLSPALALIMVAGFASPSQAVDTTIGVRGLPSISSLRRDFNSDGVLTDADIVLQLLDTLVS